MRRFGRSLFRLAATGAIAAGTLAVAPASAHAAVPTQPGNLQVTAGSDHAELTFVDRSTNETQFRVEYKQVGTVVWRSVRQVFDHRTGQPASTGHTYHVTNLPYNSSVGGCYRVKAIGAGGPASTPQKCTAEVSHGMKMARLWGWTQTSRSSFDAWAEGLVQPDLWADYDFTWATDLCSGSPDQPLGFDFRMSCRRHDFGHRNYRRLGEFNANKTRVDSALYADLLRECGTYSIVVRPVCNSLAWTYYQAVSLFGALSISQAELDRDAAWKAEVERGAGGQLQ